MISRSRRRAFRLRRSKLRRAASEQSVPKLPNSLSSARPKEPASGEESPWEAPSVGLRQAGSWTGSQQSPPASSDPSNNGDPSPTAQLLALFADPRIAEIDAEYAARELELPRQDVRNMLGALTQAGYLQSQGDLAERYSLRPDKKSELEGVFLRELQSLSHAQALAARPGAAQAGPSELVSMHEAQEDDPRMPMTAGILSLFLPGTGQLLNGDIGRAILVFAIWALAILAPHPAIIIFVRLYAGAEAFFNAKLRRLAQRRALEAAAEQRAALGPGRQALPAPGVSS